MREIKFRAWSKVDEAMITVDDIQFRDNSKVLVDGKIILQPKNNQPIIINTKGAWRSDEEFELTQFTGLYDKNGVEIYEGDVCRFDNGDLFFIDCEDYLELFVSWIGDAKCEDQARDFYRINKAEVIGNIYANPELLEVTHD